MRFATPPLGLPSLVRIATFHVEDGAAASAVEETLNRIGTAGGQPSSREGRGVRLRREEVELYAEGAEQQGFQTFLLALQPAGDSGSSPSVQESLSTHQAQLDEVARLLPSGPLALFDLRLSWAASHEEAEKILTEYQGQARTPVRSGGMLRGCLLVAFQNEQTAPSSSTLQRQFLLLPFDPVRDQAARRAWDLCGEMATLNSYAGRLSHLRSRHGPVLSQIDASEQSTQMRINEILAGLRLPLERIEPGQLEGTLTEVTTLFSRLSILAGGMRRDYVRAEGFLRGVRELFTMWNEEPLGSLPQNSSVETSACETLVAPFRDYIERVEAVRAQLDTVLQAVRTYLDIQGQRASIEEQKSSKEQLVRLVNLQEMLHKLEILIVAVYLTEMARIVFDAVAQERATLFTAAFIPLALIIAVGVSRVLHRGL